MEGGNYRKRSVPYSLMSIEGDGFNCTLYAKEKHGKRKCYGYEKFTGESLRFNRSGMVSFELLGTKGPWYDQLKFDVDRAKRRALYPDAVSMFSEYAVYIRGTTEIDLVDPRFDKYRALVDWAAENGYSMDEIIYIGSDYLDVEDDAPIRKNGVDRLVMPNSDYKFFPRIASVLL